MDMVTEGHLSVLDFLILDMPKITIIILCRCDYVLDLEMELLGYLPKNGIGRLKVISNLNFKILHNYSSKL